ncbi:MAG: VCBS repeat-containing protein [Microthrixaceae bacterium]|nr:VCBS repeat-containing protein [Microthrixaceae bacterium]
MDEDLDGAIDCADTDCGLDLTCCGGDTSDADGDGLCDVLDVCQLPNEGLHDVWLEMVNYPGDDGRGYGLTLADLNGDGIDDLLAGHPLRWMAGTGSGFGRAEDIERYENLYLNAPVPIDLDGDGDLDLMAVNWRGLVVFDNLGGGSFAQGQTVPAGATSFIGQAADIDGDGDLDIPALGVGSFWFENAGPWTLVPHPIGSTVGLSVWPADLDGDGDPDLVVPGAVTPNLAVLENLGGTFAPERTLASGAIQGSFTDIAFGDIDADGDLDIATAGNTVARNSTRFPHWYENTGGLTFVEHDLPESGGKESVELADLDGDGWLDIITGDYSSLDWYPNGGGGTFDERRPLAAQASRSLLAVELDHDGDVDLLLGYLYVYSARNDLDCVGIVNTDGDGLPDSLEFSLGMDWTNADTDGDGWYDGVDACPVDFDPTRADLDLDGFEDACDLCFGANATGDRDDDGWCDDLDPCEGDNAAGDADGDGWCDDLDGCPVVADPLQTDTDNDGTPDACDVCGGEDGDGSTLFGSLRHINGYSSYHPVAADLDGDGALDLVHHLHWSLEGYRGGEIVVSLQVPGFGLTDGMAVLWPDDVFDLAAQDLDGDGDADVVFIDDRDGVHLLDSRPPVFGAQPRRFAGTSDARVVATGDVDGDGRVDIAYVTADGDLGGFRQNAAGGWSGRMTMPSTLANPTDLLVVDVDGDGVQDLLASAGDAVAWHRGLGAGVLGQRQDLSTALPGARSLVFEDMDGDGLRDVVVLARDANEVVVLRARGAGAFDPPVAVVTDRVFDWFAYDVAVADLDRDGDPDLVVSGGYEVWWYENRGGLDFDAHVALAENPMTRFGEVVAADFDGDGDPDLAMGDVWAKNLGRCALADRDHDGLTNAEEVQVFGTDPAARDTDGGGLGDGAEVALASDPLDPADDTDLLVSDVWTGTAGQVNELAVVGATPGGTVVLLASGTPGSDAVPLAACSSSTSGLQNPAAVASAVADASGRALLSAQVPVVLAGTTTRYQVVDVSTCQLSRVGTQSW